MRHPTSVAARSGRRIHSRALPSITLALCAVVGAETLRATAPQESEQELIYRWSEHERHGPLRTNRDSWSSWPADLQRFADAERHGATLHWWWELNQNRYLNTRWRVRFCTPPEDYGDFSWDPRSHVAPEQAQPLFIGPSEESIRDAILPALRDAASREAPRLVASALIALAKIDRTDEASLSLDLILAGLESDSGIVRSSATLALGLCGHSSAVAPLIELTNRSTGSRDPDSPNSGHDRCLALYGLGLLGSGLTDEVSIQALFQAVVRECEAEDATECESAIAASHALRLLVTTAGTTPPSDRRLEAARTLLTLWSSDLENRLEGEQHDILLAHRTNALAQIFGKSSATPIRDLDELRSEFRKRLLDELDRVGRFPRTPHSYRASIQALGLMAHPIASEEDFERAEASSDLERRLDARTAVSLIRQRASTSDWPARGVVCIAMAQQGGPWLLERLIRTTRNNTALGRRDHNALAIALCHVALTSQQQRYYASYVAKQLQSELESTRSDDTLAYAALALGLLGDTSAKQEIRQRLEDRKVIDSVARSLSLTLGLLDDREHVPALRQLLDQSVRRTDRARGTALGLALIGDKQLCSQLVAWVGDPDDPTLRDSARVCSLLHDVGDRTAVAQLLVWLRNETLHPITRGFAAMALGGIAAAREEPWYQALCSNFTCSGRVPSLSCANNTGILDYP
ncbi:MAG: hypothetical protein AAF196_20700 [Planctomycetota bacterium]